MMRCTDFLEHYSEFRDGLLDDPTLLRALRRHVMECTRCMRYNASIARGALVLRASGDLKPSRRFRQQLRRRLATARAEPEPIVPAPAGVMAGLMLAAGIALVLWRLGNGPEASQALAPASRAPTPAVVAHPTMPFVTFTDLSVSPFRIEWRAPGVTRTATEAWGGIAP